MSHTQPTPEQTPPLPPGVTEQLHAAVLAQAGGHYEDAWRERFNAVEAMSKDDPHYPGAVVAAAFAARAFHTDWSTLISIAEMGIDSATEGLDLLADGKKEAAVATDGRVVILAEELVASRLHLGAMALGLAARKELRGEAASEDMHNAETQIGRAWRASEFLREGDYPGVVHQTRINTTRRQAALLGLTGKPEAGLRIAAKAIALSPLSESPRLVRNNTEGMGLKTRMRSKAKAFAGGVAAAAVCVLNLPRLRDKGRQKSLQIVARMEKAAPDIY